MPSTEELVSAVRSGDASAYAELVRRYERAAVVTAHAVLGDFHLAEDAAQEAFVAAYRMLNQLHDDARFGPWLLRIARRRASRMKRGRSNQWTDIKQIDCAATETRPWIEPFEEVVEQLARLPEHERIVTVMKYLEGRSVKEIADSIGRPVGTITKQLSRAIGRLRAWLVGVQS
jgi:RNA polymerase sigma-70 factor (ECF subfamily)